jgi:GNAT superfamily N-acetyltransferase
MAAPKSIVVRAAAESDAEALAHLACELGYPSTAAQVRERLRATSGDRRQEAFVAIDREGNILGWIQLSEARSIESEPRAEITGLVVDSRHRGAGIGRLLVERGEAWARDKGFNTIGVRSNVVRERAHLFYERLGYAAVKSQKVFRKPL